MDQGSPFLFQDMLLSPSKQKLVSYQLEWTDGGDLVLDGHRGTPSNLLPNTTDLNYNPMGRQDMDCYIHYIDEKPSSKKICSRSSSQNNITRT